MFAGRYLWWMLTGLALVAVALFAMEGAGSTLAGLFGCRTSDNACSAIAGGMRTTLKELVAWAGWGLVAGSLAARIAWLGFSPLWIAPVLVWSLSLGAALRNYLPLWHGWVDVSLLSGVVPPAGYGLVALALFLCLPLEDESGDRMIVRPAPIGRLAGLAAAGLTLHLALTAQDLPALVIRFLHMPAAAELVSRLQGGTALLLSLNREDPAPGLLAALLFAVALAMRVLAPAKAPLAAETAG